MFFLSGWELADDNVVNFFIDKERWAIGNIFNIVRIIGTGLAFIMLTWMAISYFTADGRSLPFAAERKADIKGHQLMNFAIGAAVFIGATNILYFVSNLVQQIFTNVS